MRGGKAVIALIFTLLHLTLTRSETLQFASGAASCTGGGADDEHLHPGLITCTHLKDKWKCASTRLHDAFLRIHHTRVSCSDESCTLRYRLDFTPLAVFAIGFGATVLAGLFLAIAMYLAVLKMAGRYGLSGERERFVGLRRPGYGSFGGKLYCLGHFSDSFKSLLEFDVEEGLQQEERQQEERQLQEEDKDKERAEWVEREIYLG